MMHVFVLVFQDSGDVYNITLILRSTIFVGSLKESTLHLKNIRLLDGSEGPLTGRFAYHFAPRVNVL